MKTTIAIAALLSTMTLTAVAPAYAETTVIKKERHSEFGGPSRKVVIKRHGIGGTTVKKVIRHDD